MAALRDRDAAGPLSPPLTEVAVSYLHMHANRVLRSAHRAQELVLYDFLTRYYESQAARAQDHRRAQESGYLFSACNLS
jgi:hypothetical protein